MISMTQYWQLFKERIDNLPQGNEESSNLIAIAKKMIEIGLTIETLGITQIKQVVGNLRDVTRQFGHEVFFKTPNKDYKFYLPQINNTESLIFSILYYQHLLNYEQVEYKGTISWFRQSVIDSVNEKKIPTSFQAKALLNEIINFSNSQNIDIKEEQLIGQNDELAQDYISRISKLTQPKAPSPETKAPQPSPDEMTALEQLLNELNNKKKQFKAQLDHFSNKLAEFLQARKKYLTLDNEWQTQWFITKVIYWLVSIIYQPLLLKKLKTALEQSNAAEQELNQLLTPNKSVDNYSEELKQQLELVHTESLKTQEQLKILKSQEETKTKKESKKTEPEVKKEPTTTTAKIEHTTDYKMAGTTSPSIPDPEPDDNNFSSPLTQYYSFFKQYLPSKYFVQAAAVGAAAIVIQNM